MTDTYQFKINDGSKTKRSDYSFINEDEDSEISNIERRRLSSSASHSSQIIVLPTNVVANNTYASFLPKTSHSFNYQQNFKQKPNYSISISSFNINTENNQENETSIIKEKCYRCGKITRNFEQIIKCTNLNCTKIFHKRCLVLPYTTKEMDSVWVCDDCNRGIILKSAYENYSSHNNKHSNSYIDGRTHICRNNVSKSFHSISNETPIKDGFYSRINHKKKLNDSQNEHITDDGKIKVKLNIKQLNDQSKELNKDEAPKQTYEFILNDDEYTEESSSFYVIKNKPKENLSNTNNKKNFESRINKTDNVFYSDGEDAPTQLSEYVTINDTNDDNWTLKTSIQTITPNRIVQNSSIFNKNENIISEKMRTESNSSVAKRDIATTTIDSFYLNASNNDEATDDAKEKSIKRMASDKAYLKISSRAKSLEEVDNSKPTFTVVNLENKTSSYDVLTANKKDNTVEKLEHDFVTALSKYIDSSSKITPVPSPIQPPKLPIDTIEIEKNKLFEMEKKIYDQEHKLEDQQKKIDKLTELIDFIKTRQETFIVPKKETNNLKDQSEQTDEITETNKSDDLNKLIESSESPIDLIIKSVLNKPKLEKNVSVDVKIPPENNTEIIPSVVGNVIVDASNSQNENEKIASEKESSELTVDIVLKSILNKTKNEKIDLQPVVENKDEIPSINIGNIIMDRGIAGGNLKIENKEETNDEFVNILIKDAFKKDESKHAVGSTRNNLVDILIKSAFGKSILEEDETIDDESPQTEDKEAFSNKIRDILVDAQSSKIDKIESIKDDDNAKNINITTNENEDTGQNYGEKIFSDFLVKPLIGNKDERASSNVVDHSSPKKTTTTILEDNSKPIDKKKENNDEFVQNLISNTFGKDDNQIIIGNILIDSEKEKRKANIYKEKNRDESNVKSQKKFVKDHSFQEQGNENESVSSSKNSPRKNHNSQFFEILSKFKHSEELNESIEIDTNNFDYKINSQKKPTDSITELINSNIDKNDNGRKMDSNSFANVVLSAAFKENSEDDEAFNKSTLESESYPAYPINSNLSRSEVNLRTPDIPFKNSNSLKYNEKTINFSLDNKKNSPPRTQSAMDLNNKTDLVTETMVPKPPSSFTSATYQGYLIRKRFDKLFKSNEKVYCLLDGIYFHIYKKQTDKKQYKILNLINCNIRNYEENIEMRKHQNSRKKPHLPSDKSFEIELPRGKTYQFIATNIDQSEKWYNLLKTASDNNIDFKQEIRQAFNQSISQIDSIRTEKTQKDVSKQLQASTDFLAKTINRINTTNENEKENPNVGIF